MGKNLYPPGAIFCKYCGYCLYGLTVNRCPECGREFDPGNPKTFRRRPPRFWPRRVLVWGVIALLVLGVGYGGMLAWLYVGWKAEAAARALPWEPWHAIKTRSILPSALSWLLVGDCRQWQDRVDTLGMATLAVSPGDRTLGPAEVRAIAACPRLRVLGVSAPALKREDVAVLCQCRELEDLTLIDTNLRGDDLASLSELVHLKSLNLQSNSYLDDAALGAIGKLAQLKVLYLRDSAITDAGLAHLARLTKLEDLSVSFCRNLTDAAVPHLSRLTGLKQLYVRGTALTPDAIRQLQANLPGCVISHGAPATGPDWRP